MPSPTSVAVPAMMLGISMGYKRLNITGVSHNFHQDIVVTQENKLMIRFLHFYDKGEQVSYKPFLKTDHKEGYRISEFFMILHKMFKSYEYVALFAKRRSVTVINYTRDSFIDQFTKFNSN
jgi:hypothetical protein